MIMRVCYCCYILIINIIGYYTLNWFTLYLIRALIPYHGHLVLLLNYVVLRALWKIDVHLIITLVNKSVLLLLLLP